MPRNPILPVLDWQAIFDSAKEYAAWLAAGESPENQARMEAARQSLVLEPQWASFLQGLTRPVHVVAIAEDWCGDVVRHVPILQRMADSAPNLHARYIPRAQYPQAFARFLTNGGEAIPKFIFLSDAFVECGHWGPMPDDCRRLIARGKACGDIGAARKKVSARYDADPEGREVIAELATLIDTASALAP